MNIKRYTKPTYNIGNSKTTSLINKFNPESFKEHKRHDDVLLYTTSMVACQGAEAQVKLFLKFKHRFYNRKNVGHFEL